MKKKLIKVKMAINWTIVITAIGVAGIFAPVVLKIFSSKIQKQLNGHELKINIHGKEIAKLKGDSDGYRTAIAQLLIAVKYLKKLETKIDGLSEKLEKKIDGISENINNDFREILKLINNKNCDTAKKI